MNLLTDYNLIDVILFLFQLLVIFEYSVTFMSGPNIYFIDTNLAIA